MFCNALMSAVTGARFRFIVEMSSTANVFSFEQFFQRIQLVLSVPVSKAAFS